MHISEGVLSGPVLFTGGAIAVAGVAIGLRKIDFDRIANVGIFSAAFFVASLIHVNIGPSSVHLILNGIVGLILGWAAFPAILVALILQAVFFQFGGLTVLGVNTVIMALPAIVVHYLFRSPIHYSRVISVICSFAGGFLAVSLTGGLMALSLVFTEENFWEMSLLVFSAHLPVMLIEGLITVFCISFLKKVYPELLMIQPVNT